MGSRAGVHESSECANDSIEYFENFQAFEGFEGLRMSRKGN